ncbi:MAG: DUF1549 and DUF1553 domain-containing protein [Planctomycetota bacterium]|nr:DUF1549 and DUF1553 domain-containing protein [Planctomycetota bacterium]MDA1213843.1 DUF1549 and DUF1553 domain-containing protein [Planctomycetota bacterium]
MSPRRWPFSMMILAIAACTPTASLRADDELPRPYFEIDIVPTLTKLDCNSGGCHGKAIGQNGFKLSLFGYVPAEDHEAIVQEARGRRINFAVPERSLLLLKGTNAVPHGGGVRLKKDSVEFRTLATWIARGAYSAGESDPVVERIELSPREAVFQPQQGEQSLTVTAYLSDGTSRDVTRLAVYQSNEPDIADVTRDGLVQVKDQSGLFAVMVRFGEHMTVFQGTVPFHTSGDASVASSPPESGISLIDPYLGAQWKRLGLEPSVMTSDGEFIRRVTLDICGTLPTPAEIASFMEDASPDKDARLIDRLLERPEYARYFGLLWADVLQNRGRGYSTSRQRPGTALFSGWIRDSISQNMPYDQFVREILTASGNQETNPPTVWYRTVRTTSDYVESVSQAFLGVRIQCAQCHHHPSEHWSQEDYFGLAAHFARVGRKGGFADAEVPTNEVIFLAKEGDVRHPRTGKIIPPRPLGGPDVDANPYVDPRLQLADWMTAPENPFFAQTMVNRMWGHFLGRGIIHPIDDARSTNPPTNPELLAALTRDFVAHKFDVKHLIRQIANAKAYRLSSTPNASNENDLQSFARYYPRRLKAEVLIDAISQVLDVPTNFPGGPGAFPAGTRAIDLPDEAVPSHFLDVFGRPDRSSACECERVDDPSLGQALELVGSTEIQKKLIAETGYAARLTNDERSQTAITQEIFLRVFARVPRDDEAAAVSQFFSEEADRAEAYRSLLWSLIATNEFMFNH